MGHDHGHEHGHGHDHHHHHDVANTSDGRLILAVAANLALTVAQIVGGVFAGSLSLIADALHNLNDAASLVVAGRADDLAAGAAMAVDALDTGAAATTLKKLVAITNGEA